MHNAEELLLSLIHHELYSSALIVAETLDFTKPIVAWAVFKSLLALGHNKRIKILSKRYPELLNYHEIALICIRSGKQALAQSTLHLKIPDKTLTILHSSLSNYFSGLNERERIRKRFFIQAFRDDCRNLEALTYLAKESLCTCLEIQELIDGISECNGLQCSIEEYKEYIKILFSPRFFDTASVLSPLTVLKCSLELARKRQYEELFRRAVLAVDYFPESDSSFISMGIYYLAKNIYREGKKCFETAIKLNSHSGLGYLGSGLIESMENETNLALHFLETAYAIMSSSYIPAYSLAYEYQRVSKLNKTKYFYRACLEHIIEKQGNKSINLDIFSIEHSKRSKTEQSVDIACMTRDDAEIINRAVYCFIYDEDYVEAMKFIDFFSIKNLLKVFCLLFIGKLNEAEAALKSCEIDGFFYATSGFIKHITDNIEGAIHEYGKCVAIKKIPVVEELLGMALENISGTTKNHAFDYSSSLFDTLEYNKRYNLPF
ncbi:hypothetical protein PAEPH01_0602 [Pancytospora epiphaga]|nr:hypothetical protein PAEPH01_0602 [Pancytospora epiphaga]